jgi:PhnB protein
MKSVNPYLNFNGNAEEAFNFYKKVFGGEFQAVQRLSDMPDTPGMPPMPESERKKIVHISLPIGKSNMLMASDVFEAFGQGKVAGNNVHLSLEAETKEEADKIFNALAAGGEITMPMATQFWGAYYGMLTDKFGILWMMSFNEKGTGQ